MFDLHKKSFLSNFVVSRENFFYYVWNLIITNLCIISAFMYAYYAAFGCPTGKSLESNFDIVFTVAFSMDIVLRFFLTYVDK